MVGDWKTNEKIKTDKDHCFNYLQGPFSKWKENELNKYSIQISIYQLLLEEAGIFSNYGFVCHLPTGDAEPKIYKLHNFKEELRAHLDSELYLTGDSNATEKSIDDVLFGDDDNNDANFKKMIKSGLKPTEDKGPNKTKMW